MPIPGHPVGSWRYEGENSKAPPTPAELRDIFDEQDGLGTLSTGSWLALRRLGEAMNAEPIQFGELVCRPEPEQFDPSMLEGQIPPDRLDALTIRHAPPTTDELARWESLYMKRAHEDDTPALYAVHGWAIRDDGGRERVLVTLHVDRGTFDSVAGLYPDVQQAELSLREYGDFRWLW